MNVDPGLTCRDDRFQEMRPGPCPRARKQKCIGPSRHPFGLSPEATILFSCRPQARNPRGCRTEPLCSAARAVLPSDMGVQALPTGVYGPLPSRYKPPRSSMLSTLHFETGSVSEPGACSLVEQAAQRALGATCYYCSLTQGLQVCPAAFFTEVLRNQVLRFSCVWSKHFAH